MDKGFIKAKDNMFRTDAVNAIQLKGKVITFILKNAKVEVKYETLKEAKDQFESFFKGIRSIMSRRIDERLKEEKKDE